MLTVCFFCGVEIHFLTANSSPILSKMRNNIVAIIFMAMTTLQIAAITNPNDISALKNLKAAVDPSTATPSTCLGSWDFSSDPCHPNSPTHFTCGLDCDSTDPSNRRVTALALDAAQYRGTISPSLGDLSSLQEFSVSGNSFKGSIPETIGNLGNLKKLDMSDNILSGSIPTSMANLTNLEYLSLSNNLLEGTFPHSFGNLHQLQRLSVYNNNLTGKMPSLSKLPLLRYFDASSNALSGTISPYLFPISIIQLSLRSNNLGGRLSERFSKLRELEVLDLSHNLFVGRVDQSLFQLPFLQQLNLSHNQLTRISVPDLSVVNSELVAVDMSYNHLTGSLPINFASINTLSALSLSHNLFTGTLPYQYAIKAMISEDHPSDGKKPLVRLFLDSNYLSGKIPAPYLKLLPEQITASLILNCLVSCPADLFFCKGGGQRPPSECKSI